MPPQLAVFCLAIIGKNNNPLYLRNFTSLHSDLKLHYIAHTACDVVDERLNIGVKHGELYLGMLTSIEDCAVHGYLTNTHVKLFLILPLSDAAVRDGEIRTMFRRIHVAYAQLVLNPFYDVDGLSFHPVADAGGRADVALAQSLAHSGGLVDAARGDDESAEPASPSVPTISMLRDYESFQAGGEPICSALFARRIDAIVSGVASPGRTRSPNALSPARARPLPSVPAAGVSPAAVSTAVVSGEMSSVS